MTNEAVSQELTTLLYEDEKVLWQGKPNRKGLVLDTVFKMLPILLIWLALDSVFIGIMIAEDVFKGQKILRDRDACMH